MIKSRFSILAFITAALVVLGVLWLIQTKEASESDYAVSYGIEFPDNDTAFGGIFRTVSINDSLPYYRYKRIEDSILNIKRQKEIINEGKHAMGWSFGPFGITRINDKEYSSYGGANDSFYLSLIGYELDWTKKFFIENGTYHLAYQKYTHSKTETGSPLRMGHYERKQIAVRYSEPRKQLFIPITEQQHKVLNVVLKVTLVIVLFILTYIFMGIPVAILLKISKGNAFNLQNIRWLRILAYASFVVWLIKLLVPYILRFFFRKMIPDDFYLPHIGNALYNNMGTLIMAIVIFVISKAFQKGYQLQKDQDLTI